MMIVFVWTSILSLDKELRKMTDVVLCTLAGRSPVSRHTSVAGSWCAKIAIPACLPAVAMINERDASPVR
jgi:hypothetical protein